MASNFNNISNTSNNGSDLDLVKQYNQRAATLISNGERLIPLQALQKYFPALFENRTPHVDNMSKGRLNQSETLLCQAYQPPNDLTFNGSNANANPVHITDNAGGGTDVNCFNGHVRNTSNYAVDPPSALKLEPIQQLGCPSNQGLDSLNTGFDDPQSFSAANWTNTSSASFIDPLSQYPDQNQLNVGRTVKQNSQLLFGNNACGVNNLTLPPLNGAALHNRTFPTWSLPNGAYNPVTALNLSVGMGPNMQNMHAHETKPNMTSAMTAGAYPNSFLNTFDPVPTLFPNSSNSLYPANQDFPLNSFPTGTSTINTSPSNSLSMSPAPEFIKSDAVPGLYEQIDERIWKCTFEECGQVMYGKRNRTRHIGTHAKWEENLISAGCLELKDAVAIPRAKFVTYECDVPECRYLLVTGQRYYVEDYRVDGHRKIHIQKFHPHKTVRRARGEGGKQKKTRV